jgi:protein O-mannosyl-transferase
MSATEDRWRWAGAALVALTFCVYLNAFGNEFLWDDVVLIVNNPAIKHWETAPSLLAGDILPGPAESPQSNYFRPLQMLSYALDYQVWGLSPFGFHFTSTLLHALAAVLLFGLGRRLLGDPGPAFAAAALWAVHPVHTEAVTYLSGRSDPLGGVCLLAALLAFLRDREERSWRWRTLSLTAFFLALLAREAALAWLLLLPLVDLALDQRQQAESPRTPWRERVLWRYTPFLAVAAVYLGLRGLVTDLAPMAAATAQVSLGRRLLTMLEVVVRYLAFLVMPAEPHMERRVEPAAALAEPAVLGSALLVGALVYLAWEWRRRAWPVAFGVAWFLLALTAVSNVLPLATFMAEHWLYVPSMGLFLAAGWGAGRLAQRRRQQVTMALVSAVAVFGLATARRNRDWRDARTFFESTVAAAPWSAKAWSNLGNAYLELGEVEKARPALEQAIGLAGGAAPLARLDLGILHRQQGRHQEALAELRALAATDPRNALAYNEIALTLAALGRQEEAGAAFATALELDPMVAAIHSNYGNWHFRRDELDRALERYRAALQLDPDFADAYNNLGSVRFRRGEYKLAVIAYRRALELDPSLETARANIEVVRARVLSERAE